MVVGNKFLSKNEGSNLETFDGYEDGGIEVVVEA
jgi:hypothetical protein